jgi:DnaJ C terminal domain
MRYNNRKTVDVHIPKGSLSGQSIVLSGEADFNHDTTPGDVIFILTQAPHPTFTRKGHDLAMELTIGLDEAISGVERPIRHLDGSEIWIQSASSSKRGLSSKLGWPSHHHHHHHSKSDQDSFPDATAQSSPSPSTKETPLVIQTGDVQVLKGRGMPKRHLPGEFGDLYIQYRVEMPDARNGDALTPDEHAELSRLLTKLQGTGKHDNDHHRRHQHQHRKEDGHTDRDRKGTNEIHILQAAKPEDFGRASGKVMLDDEDTATGGGLHDDHGDEFHPFASGASSFFHSGGTGGTSRFYFGSSGNHFGMGGNEDDDDGNVQCQQM